MAFQIKSGDTSPILEKTLTDGDENPVNLTGATVRFHMGRRGAALTVDEAADVVTAAEGTVSYTWQAGDTDTPGVYKGEFEVTYADGSIETFPNDTYVEIHITPALG